jgi:hypothetical protein
MRKISVFEHCDESLRRWKAQIDCQNATCSLHGSACATFPCEVLLGVVEAESLREGLKVFLSKPGEFHSAVVVGNVASCIDNEDILRVLIARDCNEGG